MLDSDWFEVHCLLHKEYMEPALPMFKGSICEFEGRTVVVRTLFVREKQSRKIEIIMCEYDKALSFSRYKAVMVRAEFLAQIIFQQCELDEAEMHELEKIAVLRTARIGGHEIQFQC